MIVFSEWIVYFLGFAFTALLVVVAGQAFILYKYKDLVEDYDKTVDDYRDLVEKLMDKENFK